MHLLHIAERASQDAEIVAPIQDTCHASEARSTCWQALTHLRRTAGSITYQT
jgi:hypothetical protein